MLAQWSSIFFFRVTQTNSAIHIGKKLTDKTCFQVHLCFSALDRVGSALARLDVAPNVGPRSTDGGCLRGGDDAKTANSTTTKQHGQDSLITVPATNEKNSQEYVNRNMDDEDGSTTPTVSSPPPAPTTTTTHSNDDDVHTHSSVCSLYSCQAEVATAEFDVSVKEFYERFVADDAPYGLPEFHMSRGDWEVSSPFLSPSR